MANKSEAPRSTDTFSSHLIRIGCVGSAAISTIGLIPCAVASILVGNSEIGIITGAYASCLIPFAALSALYLIQPNNHQR